MFSKKATKIEEIFTVDLTLCSKCQINGEDFVIFCGLLRKHKLNAYTFTMRSRLINLCADKRSTYFKVKIGSTATLNCL